MENDYQKLKKFFDSERKIKSEIEACNPDINEKGNLISEFYKIESEVYKMLSTDLFSDELKQKVEEKIKSIKYNLINLIQQNPDEAYRTCIGEFREKVKNEISENLSAFSQKANLDYVTNNIGNSQSIRELVYMLRSYITETPELWNDMDTIISTASGSVKNCWITVKGKYGVSTETAKKIFNDLFFNESNMEERKVADIAENTKLLALEDRVLIAVEGRGNGFTMEIDEIDPKKPILSYHIPSINGITNTRVFKTSNEISFSHDSLTGSFVLDEDIPVSKMVKAIFYAVPFDKDVKGERFDNKKMHELMNAMQEVKTDGEIKQDSEEEQTKKIPNEKTIMAARIMEAVSKFSEADPEPEKIDEEEEGLTPEQIKAKKDREFVKSINESLRKRRLQEKESQFGIDDAKEVAESTSTSKIKSMMDKIKGKIKGKIEDFKNGGSDGR